MAGRGKTTPGEQAGVQPVAEPSAKPGKRRRRPEVFSVVAAVKANARTRVGQPRPARVLEVKSREHQEKKHKPSVAERLRAGDAEQ